MTVRRTSLPTVSQQGAVAGSVLCGTARSNRGLRLRVSQEQARGSDGPIEGPFVILDVGDNAHSESLQALLHRVTHADEVLGLIRQGHRMCVNVVNARILAPEQQEPDGLSREDGTMTDEKGTPAGSPEPTRPWREPGNEWLTPEAERPPRRGEGVVSDPGLRATGPAALTMASANPGAGKVSDPDS